MDLIKKIDFSLLRNQKAYLLSLPKNEYIDGVINLIDEIQDFAADELGLSVFEHDSMELDMELPKWADKLLLDKYTGEFVPIDGVRQHPDGLNFDQWLKANGYN